VVAITKGCDKRGSRNGHLQHELKVPRTNVRGTPRKERLLAGFRQSVAEGEPVVHGRSRMLEGEVANEGKVLWMPDLAVQRDIEDGSIEGISDFEQTAAGGGIANVGVVHPFADFMRQRADVGIDELLVGLEIRSERVGLSSLRGRTEHIVVAVVATGKDVVGEKNCERARCDPGELFEKHGSDLVIDETLVEDGALGVGDGAGKDLAGRTVGVPSSTW